MRFEISSDCVIFSGFMHTECERETHTKGGRNPLKSNRGIYMHAVLIHLISSYLFLFLDLQQTLHLLRIASIDEEIGTSIMQCLPSYILFSRDCVTVAIGQVSR